MLLVVVVVSVAAVDDVHGVGVVDVVVGGGVVDAILAIDINVIVNVGVYPHHCR